MKNRILFRTALVIVASVSLLACTTPGAPLKHGAEPLPAGSTVADQAPVSGTFTGTISGGHWAKGFGFSNINIYLEVAAEGGVMESFYVRSDSRVFDASGTQVDYREAFRGYNKKVRIEYFTITDATGGDPSRDDFKFEIGKKGVRTLHFLE
jgi:hypothetical protein